MAGGELGGGGELCGDCVWELWGRCGGYDLKDALVQSVVAVMSYERCAGGVANI